MRADRTTLLAAAGLAAVLVSVIWTATANAYSQWSINDDATYCGECHGDFRAANYISPVDGENWGNLHNLHRNTMLEGEADCETCHGAGDRFPVKLNQAAGGNGLDPISCMGCHGVDPGTSEPHWGVGLRAHHINAGVVPDQNGDTCAAAACHPSDPAPSGENTLPSHYFTPDPAHPDKPTDPCNPSPGYPEDFAGLVLGLDNDGDLLYDGADPDCSGIFADGFESGDTLAWSADVP